MCETKNRAESLSRSRPANPRVSNWLLLCRKTLFCQSEGASLSIVGGDGSQNVPSRASLRAGPRASALRARGGAQGGRRGSVGGAGAPPGRPMWAGHDKNPPAAPPGPAFRRRRGRGCDRGLLVHCFPRQKEDMIGSQPCLLFPRSRWDYPRDHAGAGRLARYGLHERSHSIAG